MAVVEELDAGPVAAAVPFKMGPRDDAGDVMERSLELGAPPLAATLADAAAGSLATTPQAAAGVVYAHKLTAADRLLDPRGAVVDADRRVRALAPHIGAALCWRGSGSGVARAAGRRTPWRPAAWRRRVASWRSASPTGRSRSRGSRRAASRR